MTSTRVAFYSILLNIAVVTGKGLLAYLTGSTALLAETLHSLSDLSASFATWVGVRISQLKSSDFPFGLYKVENLVAMVSAALIFFAGYEITRESFFAQKQVNIQHIPVALGGLAVILMAIYFFAGYESRKGKELNSPALKADAYHLYTDSVSAVIVIVGLLGSILGYHFFDRLSALIVVLFIVRAGWRILIEAMRSLLDASVDRATLDNIRAVVLSDPRVQEIKSIIARNSGSVIFINLDLVCNLDGLDKVNAAREEIASAIKATVPHVEGIQITMEPVVKKHLLVAVPLADNHETISEHFGKAPYIAILKVTKKSFGVEQKTLLTNPFASDEKGKGMHLAHYLLEKNVDLLYTRESLDGKGPIYIMEAGGIGIRKTAGNSLDDVLTQMSQTNPD